MSINKSYAVFGLGRYGAAVAKELVKNGADVLAVDIDENIVNKIIMFGDYEEPLYENKAISREICLKNKIIPLEVVSNFVNVQLYLIGNTKVLQYLQLPSSKALCLFI